MSDFGGLTGAEAKKMFARDLVQPMVEDGKRRNSCRASLHRDLKQRKEFDDHLYEASKT